MRGWSWRDDEAKPPLSACKLPERCVDDSWARRGRGLELGVIPVLARSGRACKYTNRVSKHAFGQPVASIR